MVGPALELFEEIELWDALVVCLGLLGKKQAAADVVRRRLAEDPRDAKLWCALGDALDDESAYEKALEVSGGRSARARVRWRGAPRRGRTGPPPRRAGRTPCGLTRCSRKGGSAAGTRC